MSYTVTYNFQYLIGSIQQWGCLVLHISEQLPDTKMEEKSRAG